MHILNIYAYFRMYRNYSFLAFNGGGINLERIRILQYLDKQVHLHINPKINRHIKPFANITIQNIKK